MRRFRIAIAATLLLAACATPGYVPEITDTGNYDMRTINGVAAPVAAQAISYGSDSPAQVGELRLPQGRGPFPVAMVVHGGCWVRGMGSTRNTAALSSWLAERGVATWNIHYRELGAGGGWSATFEDWALALARLKGLAQVHNLDLGRLTVIGHSAGATAAAWLAAGDKGDVVVARDLPRVRAAVVLDGPVRAGDLAGADEAICGRPVLAELMGGRESEVPGRYAMVDPLRHPGQGTKFLVVQGQIPLAADVIGELTAQGYDASLIRLSGESHFNLLAPGTRDFVAIAPALLAATGGR